MTDVPEMKETLFRLNGTLLKEGDTGRALTRCADALEKIATHLEKMNWNLGTIAKNTKPKE